MPRTSVVFSLQPDILKDFNAELVSHNFCNLDYLSLWLSNRGYNISRSAIHRYATQYKEMIVSAQATPEQLAIMGFRVQCLEIASRLVRPEDLYSKADELLAWARLP